jgi:hypothetical protein
VRQEVRRILNEKHISRDSQTSLTRQSKRLLGDLGPQNFTIHDWPARVSGEADCLAEVFRMDPNGIEESQ